MARRRNERGIALPWENRGNPIGRLFAGARSRGVVVGLLALSGLVLLVRSAEQRAAERQTRIAVDETTRAVLRFRADHHRCPHSIDELLHPPLSGTRYLHETPRDGWGNPLLVRCPGLRDPDDVDVLAAGSEGSFFDDEIPR